MFRFAVVVMLLCGCGVDRLSRVEPAVDVQPAVLDFGRVFTGEAARGEVTVTNRTAASVQVALEVGAPFSLGESTLALAAAESRVLVVELLPTGIGPLEATLDVRPGSAITLLAQVAAREDCGVPTACESFTPACERITSPDGAACNTACVTSGSCVAGQCAGAPIDCDDRDLCTSDSCGPSGCAHSAIVCDSPTDPCKAARCDPTLGCVSEDVSDGTSCGANDCSTAMVCITGRCVARAAPEGSTCAAAAGCREESRCQAGTCIAGPRRPLFPAWTFPVQGGLSSSGLRVGNDGHLYFVERTGPTPIARRLVSLDATGQLRFRVNTGFTQYDSPLFLVSADVVVIASTTHRFSEGLLLEARSTTDGALLWSTTYDALFPVPETALCSSVPSTWIGADPSGHLMVRATMHSRCTDIGVGFAVLDLHTGAVISRRQTPPWMTSTNVPRSAVIDSLGRWVYVESNGSRLAAWTFGGTQAWNTNPRFGPIAATPGGRLVTSDGTVLHPMGTAVAGSTLTTAYPRGGALTGRLERAFFLTHSNGAEQVEKFDLVNPRTLWRHSVSGSGNNAAGFLGILTGRDSVVFPTRNASLAEAELVEISWEGDEVTRCTLRSRQAFERVLPIGQAALLQNRWVVYDGYHSTVSAYDVEGITPAAHGWMTSVGTQGGEMRPR